MLRPQDGPTRESRRLDGLWDFTVDPDGVGRADGWWRAGLRCPRTISVPASYNDVFADQATHDHVGDVWYQKRVWIPRGWADERIVLRFDSATHRAAVWVDEQEVAAHEGGYTPFEADVTDIVHAGQEVRITVVVDNELSWSSIPPGFVEERSDRPRRQVYFHDFFNYAGLHRSVWLYSTPRTHLRDLKVSTDIDGDAGLVRYAAAVSDGDGVEIRAALRDAAGALVAESRAAQGELRVERAELWRPGRGYLYELEVTLHRGDSLLDRYLQPVGIRTVGVEGTRFLINGEPFHFRGFGMHEDHLVRGKGHDAPSMLHDLALLEWTGANSFRTSHYPYAEEWLDEADRRGIVVIDETAAVGLNFHGHGAFPFDDDEGNGPLRQAAHRRAIDELINRDRNHPSVVLWSIANEPESDTPASRAYFEPLFAAARAADPSRPVGFVNMIQGTPAGCRLTELADVVMLNRYYGWYQDTGDLVAAERALESELTEWAERHGKPILVTEYGADTVAGLHAVVPVPWSEEYQEELFDLYHRVFDRIDAVVGEHVWNFADFATAPMTTRVDGNKKGVFTRDRRPKSAARLLRRRWTG